MRTFKLCITGDLGFEFWKDIPGFEGQYQASTYGRIKSFARNSNGNILSPRNIKGYYSYHLSKNGIAKNYSGHKLIAQTFLPKWSKECIYINHKDENKRNNVVWNIEYCTPWYNTNYGTRNKRVSEKMTNGKLSKSVLQFDLEGNFIREWPSLMEIKRQLDFNITNISACCRGIVRKSGNGCEYITHKVNGYIWKYKD